MVNLFFISDTHFGHRNMVEKFTLPDGSKARDFTSVEEMDELLIKNWNDRVKPQDHIYHLGDVTMHRQIGQIAHSVLDRLNGHMRLLPGNHDVDKIENYLKWFKKIYTYRVIDRMLFTHVPVHPESLGSFSTNIHANIHGHTHHRNLKTETVVDHKGYGDKKRRVPYINICVEKTNYTPISLEEIKAMVEKEK